VQLITPGDPPIMPAYLSPRAQEIWMEEISRVMQAGVSELDSSMVGDYCSLYARVQEAFEAGGVPPAAHLTELRRTRELLGIAGPRSRQGLKDGPMQTSENPFTRNGRKQV
jgi:phage terminase small subunit